MKILIANLKHWFLRLVRPIQIILQRTGRQETRITYDDVRNIGVLCQEGDIFLSYESGRPTSFLIKGDFDHAAILSSKHTIVEAVGDYYKLFEGKMKNVGGVREKDFEEWLYKKDCVAVIRPILRDSTGKIINTPNKIAAVYSLSLIGRTYDYEFRFDGESLYCSEVPYVCYRSIISDFLNFVGKYDEILPQFYYDLTSTNKEFQLIYDSRSINA